MSEAKTIFLEGATALQHLLDPNNWFGAVLYAVIFLFIAMFLSRVIRLATTRVLMRENVLVDRTVAIFLTQLAQISVYVLGLIIFFHIVPALNRLGTALLTGVSVMSVVFGLAAQNTLGNLVAGLTLLLYRPFHLDDLIQVATPTGTEVGIVERLTLGYTMMRTADDRVVIVPNSLMASQVTLNLNRKSLHSMVIIPIGVLETQHVGEVHTALLDLARHNPKIHRLIGIHTQSLEDGATILSLRGWCSDTATAMEVKQDISKAIQERFANKKTVLLVPHPLTPDTAKTPPVASAA